MKISRRYKGFLAIVMTALLYSFGGVYVRMVGMAFGVFNQMWIRNGLVVVLVGVFLWLRKQKIKIKKEDWKWLVLWGGLSAITSGGFIVAANKLALGTAYLVFMSCMILGGFVAGKIWHEEKINKIKIASLLLIVSGLAMIYFKEIAFGNLWYLLVAVVGGVANGFWIGVSKRMSKRYQEFEVVVLDGVASTITGVAVALALGERLPRLEWSVSWLGIVLFVITQIIGLALVFYAYKVIEAQEGVLVVPLQIVFASLIGWLLFSEILTGLTIVGGLLILAGAVLPQVPRKWYKKLRL